MNDIANWFWHRVRGQHRRDRCWLWQGGRTKRGYGSIRRRDLPGVFYAHRLAYELKHRPIPRGVKVCHTCDNPPCCNPHHLFLGTQAKNMQDCAAKGRNISQRQPDLFRGERNGNSKLTDDIVRAIRKLANEGFTRTELARCAKVARSVIDGVVARRAWAHVV